MKYKLYAFWKHDIPPYVLGGEVTEIKSNGRVCVKGFTGYSFLPLQILPLEEGRAKQKEIDLALKNYKNTIKKAEEELRSHTKQLSLKYTLTEIGHEHVNDFLKECSAKRKEILDAGIDTACQTSLPTKADILRELNDGENIDDSGEYDSDWAVTDNTDEDFAYVKCRLAYGFAEALWLEWDNHYGIIHKEKLPDLLRRYNLKLKKEKTLDDIQLGFGRGLKDTFGNTEIQIKQIAEEIDKICIIANLEYAVAKYKI